MGHSPTKSPQFTPGGQTVSTASADVEETDVVAAKEILSSLDGKEMNWFPEW